MARRSTKVQTLLLERTRFTSITARKWARDHGYSDENLTVGKRYWKFAIGGANGRQCQVFTIKQLRVGVKAVVCR